MHTTAGSTQEPDVWQEFTLLETADMNLSVADNTQTDTHTEWQKMDLVGSAATTTLTILKLMLVATMELFELTEVAKAYFFQPFSDIICTNKHSNNILIAHCLYK